MPELVGLARTMRSLAAEVHPSRADLVDTAGTGGGPSTFNVSTTAALVAAGAGCRGRQARQPLQHQPLRLGRPARGARRQHRAGARTRSPSCIDEVGFGFMFAPRHHAAMKHVVPVRKELAVRTIFNFLGPLTNPAGAGRQLLGVSDRRFQETIAEALRRPRHGARAGGQRRRRPRRDLDRLATRVIEVLEGRTEEWFVSAGRRGPLDGAPGRGRGGEPRRRTPRSRAGARRRARAPPATSSSSTPPPRSTSATRRPTSPTASTRPSRRSTRARPRRCWTRLARRLRAA